MPPGPYGRQNASMYYQHGAVPRHYAYDWLGLPMPSQRAAETKALGAATIDADCRVRYRSEGLDGCCDSCDAGGPCGTGDTWPVRQSAFTGLRSVRNSGPEQTTLAGLSRMEGKAVTLGALALAGFMIWKALG